MADISDEMENNNKQSQILQRLKIRGPQSVRILASHLGITTMGVRQHLAVMENQGLVKQTREARQNRGRPVHLWTLSGMGHARFPDRHQSLSLDLIEAIDRTLGSDQLSSLIGVCGSQQLQHYSALLETAADDLGERLRLLAELRTDDGFMAEIRLLPEGWLLIENHCPLHAAASRCPEFCDAELNMLRTLLQQHADVERADHLLAGARRCAFKITVKAAAQS
ncbi:MAG: ArsR family transcriptional regulator [Proteobacteria bacterium]|nr:ArsR family transcriptional regulator [Pseudomonadota bacterium]MDA0929386.1 ArsR family transcriptional regulator [Pseudomonadota bacterium]